MDRLDQIRLLSMIGDVSIVVYDSLQKLNNQAGNQATSTAKIKLPSIIYLFLQEFCHPNNKLPTFGGDLGTPVALPSLASSSLEPTLQAWLDIGVFALVSAATAVGMFDLATSACTVGAACCPFLAVFLVRRLQVIQKDHIFSEKNFENIFRPKIKKNHQHI